MRIIDKIFADVVTERERAVHLRDCGKFTHCISDPGMPDAIRLAVLMEEVGEVAKEMQETGLYCLRCELVQVAAAAVGWIEHLDKMAEDA